MTRQAIRGRLGIVPPAIGAAQASVQLINFQQIIKPEGPVPGIPGESRRRLPGAARPASAIRSRCTWSIGC